MKKIVLIFLLLVASPTFAAVQADYKYCTTAGYWFGTDDSFMGGLASHIVSKRGLATDPVCMGAWKSAYEVGQRVSRGGIKKEDMPVVNQANEMSNKVYDFIEKNAGL